MAPGLDNDGVEEKVGELGRQILAEMDVIERRQGRFNRRAAYDRLIALSMKDPDFKAQLFRLVDVLPALNDSASILSHFSDYLRDASSNLPLLPRLGIRAGSRVPWPTAPLVRRNVMAMARRFIIPDSPEEILATLREREKLGLDHTVDLLGEKVVSECEADEYAHRVATMLDLLARNAKERAWHTGNNRWPRVNLSLKISALDPQILPTDPDGAIDRLKHRLRPILRQARKQGAFINFDMEHYQLKDLTLRLFRSLLEEEEFRDFQDAGIALQAYLRDCEDDLRGLIEWTRRHNRRIAVRLVKGAYWDYELAAARYRNWPAPVFEQKPETDQNFERLSVLLLENADHTLPAIASHNVRSIARTLVQAEKRGIESGDFEFQMLYGMADSLKEALTVQGFRVREYSPVGDLIPGMAYLVRRLLENSSNEGFLASRFARRAPAETLLATPGALIKTTPPGRKPSPPGPEATFTNAPPTDFTMDQERTSLKNTIASVRERCPITCRLIIGGEEITTGRTLTSPNPARPNEPVGIVPRSGPDEVKRAVEAAGAAAAHWAATPAESRAEIIDTVATILDRRRHEFTALEILESGKPWAEADGDVCEAIDFCRYYADTMRILAHPEPTQLLPGEENLQVWRPRGVAAVIAPWNFPLAILCGMTAASLVTGNTVVIKPAEQSPVIAAWFMEVLIEAGVPAGAANLVTGLGEEAGEPLVNHQEVALIAFTGSREVGLRIWEAAGKTDPRQRHLKKAVCEMGGKNALIIDSDADLDEAVHGAVYSAFGYQGQKCSALARLIVHTDIHERFLKRFIEATRAIAIGDPADPATFMGPLIDEDAKNKALRFIERGKEEGELVFEGKIPENLEGCFVPPVIFAGVPPGARLFHEEVFGPVVAVTRADSLDEAISLANNSHYGLTGGIYSRSPANIAKAKAALEVGNLYINRHITGSIVGRQPFGGFKMSGSGTKAGGREYLLQFMVPQIITENTMRHGFAPETADKRDARTT